MQELVLGAHTADKGRCRRKRGSDARSWGVYGGPGIALKMIDDGCRHRVREDPGRQAGCCITNSYNAATTGNR